MYPVQHYLIGTPPHVFTMQLAWQSNNEKGSEIKLAMEALSQVNTYPQRASEQSAKSFVPCLHKTAGTP